MFDWIKGLARGVGHTTAAAGALDRWQDRVVVVPTERQARGWRW